MESNSKLIIINIDTQSNLTQANTLIPKVNWTNEKLFWK